MKVNWKYSEAFRHSGLRIILYWYLFKDEVKIDIVMGKNGNICWKPQSGKGSCVGFIMCNVWKTPNNQNGNPADSWWKKKPRVTTHHQERHWLERCWHAKKSVSRHWTENNGKNGLLDKLVTGRTKGRDTRPIIIGQRCRLLTDHVDRHFGRLSALAPLTHGPSLSANKITSKSRPTLSADNDGSCVVVLRVLKLRAKMFSVLRY